MHAERDPFDALPRDLVPRLVFDALQASDRDLVSLIDRNWTIRWSNRPDLLRCAAEPDPVGTPCYEYYRKRSAPCTDDCPIRDAFATGRRHTVRRVAPRPDGSRARLVTRAYPIRDETGRVAYALKHTVLKRIERAAPDAEPDALTPREREVLGLVARGLTNRAIARVLSISPHTVKTHVDHVLAKLDVGDRTEAAVLAAKNGWI